MKPGNQRRATRRVGAKSVREVTSLRDERRHLIVRCHVPLRFPLSLMFSRLVRLSLHRHALARNLLQPTL